MSAQFKQMQNGLRIHTVAVLRVSQYSGTYALLQTTVFIGNLTGVRGGGRKPSFGGLDKTQTNFVDLIKMLDYLKSLYDR
jgi:hypothetical protein